MIAHLIGLDIGTSAIKGVLMSASGAITARETAPTRTEKHSGGLIQFDAEDLYRLTAGVISSLVSQLPRGDKVAGLCLSSASGNTVLVDGEGKPMRPAISWMDARMTDELELVFGKLNHGEVHNQIGWPLIPAFPLAHLAWLRCHEPEWLDQSAIVCMSSEYILFRLTGKWGIDPSTATTFYLRDQRLGDWHTPFLDRLGIDSGKLPHCYASGSILGGLLPESSLDTGLVQETPVVLGSFDHPSAARGTGVLEEGHLLLSCGTSWVGFYPLKDRNKGIQLEMLVDPFLQPGGPWGAMFALTAIGAFVEDKLCRHISAAPDRYERFNALAASAAPGAGGLIVVPAWDEGADGLAGHDQAQVARALMEGVAYLLRMKIDALKAEGLLVHSLTMVGGPSESKVWTQMTADILGIELRIINGNSAGAVGSAIMAGVGTGIYADEKEAWRRLCFPISAVTPEPEASERYRELYQSFADQTKDREGD